MARSPAEILAAARTIALVGASPRPERPSNSVMRYLLGVGYRVIPVRPTGPEEILGQRRVGSLADIDEPVDLVDVFRRPEYYRLIGGFELAPVDLDLMAEAEREAALEGLAALYDAIPRAFHLLSVPTDRPPHEHLALVEERVDGRRAAGAFSAYAALYRELAAAARRPLRRTYLLLEGTTEPELRRAIVTAARVAEERGITLREAPAEELAERWSELARVGTPYQLGAQLAVGGGLIAGLSFSRRWPAEVAPGWLSGLLGTPGLTAVSMRVRRRAPRR